MDDDTRREVNAWGEVHMPFIMPKQRLRLAEMAYAAGRRAGLEEAARVCDNAAWPDDSPEALATIIRALLDKEPT